MVRAVCGKFRRESEADSAAGGTDNVSCATGNRTGASHNRVQGEGKRVLMKTRLLWALNLSMETAALYCGVVRAEASTDPKRIREYLEQDLATHPAVQLPPLVVAEPRLPAEPLSPAGPPSKTER
jgi:hypothetical protein